MLCPREKGIWQQGRNTTLTHSCQPHKPAYSLLSIEPHNVKGACVLGVIPGPEKINISWQSIHFLHACRFLFSKASTLPLHPLRGETTWDLRPPRVSGCSVAKSERGLVASVLLKTHHLLKHIKKRNRASLTPSEKTPCRCVSSVRASGASGRALPQRWSKGAIKRWVSVRPLAEEVGGGVGSDLATLWLFKSAHKAK